MNVFAKILNYIMYQALILFPINSHLIMFESEGDLCDNAYALYDHMVKKGILNNYQVVWVVNDPDTIEKKRFYNTRFVSRKKNIINFGLMYAMRTCKYYIYDHNCMYSDSFKSRGNKVIYLTHGRGFKAAKGRNRSPFDIMIATGAIPAKGLAYFWGVQEEKIFNLGYPRIDYFFEKSEDTYKIFDNELQISKYKKMILWMPTFRQSRSKEISEDYINSETGLPMVNTIQDMLTLNECLANENTLLVMKVHHLQADLPVFDRAFSNIVILKDEKLVAMNKQLYQFVSLSDALITDYSSIAIDYLLLNKPIIYTLDDYEDYKKTRGFEPEDPVKYMKGYHTYNLEQLCAAIVSICHNEDSFAEERKSIIPLFFDYADGNACNRIMKFLEIE